jgi:NAD(P)-dependent dehydrogenase (short-subunit alcohol dehydrogenase family)
VLFLGSTSGIGRATALLLAKQGALITLHGGSNEDEAKVCHCNIFKTTLSIDSTIITIA